MGQGRKPMGEIQPIWHLKGSNPLAQVDGMGGEVADEVEEVFFFLLIVVKRNRNFGETQDFVQKEVCYEILRACVSCFCDFKTLSLVEFGVCM